MSSIGEAFGRADFSSISAAEYGSDHATLVSANRVSISVSFD
jgi:hypothetical protein